ncbi:uncharacterized protein BYT42DRAFT_65495 [Radiomyces spectabilis]|uniref:uncharacterized protein n=1 Tax=Radiomyces spectabilis TaxID=64574 RepID=UPI00221E729B|nr:uncharacterized protein BYT42DRAFT_65495 [Radiomyces spectabilis]KAI8371368.1 hypothetical protein BYT42DRAFT_65495 [Radiomyces spectabilis]
MYTSPSLSAPIKQEMAVPRHQGGITSDHRHSPPRPLDNPPPWNQGVILGNHSPSQLPPSHYIITRSDSDNTGSREQLMPSSSSSSSLANKSAYPYPTISQQEAAKAARNSNRAVIPSKRAAQNRAAQKAFRQRREQYVRDLEQKAKEMDEWKDEMDHLRMENQELRDIIRSLEKRISNLTGEPIPTSSSSFSAQGTYASSATTHHNTSPSTRGASANDGLNPSTRRRAISVSDTNTTNVKQLRTDNRVLTPIPLHAPKRSATHPQSHPAPSSQANGARKPDHASGYAIPVDVMRTSSTLSISSPSDPAPSLPSAPRDDTILPKHAPVLSPSPSSSGPSARMMPSFEQQQQQQQQVHHPHHQQQQPPQQEPPLSPSREIKQMMDPSPRNASLTRSLSLSATPHYLPSSRHTLLPTSPPSSEPPSTSDLLALQHPGQELDIAFEFDPFFDDEFGPSPTTNDFVSNATSGQVLDDLFAMLQTRQRPQIPVQPTTTMPSVIDHGNRSDNNYISGRMSSPR